MTDLPSPPRWREALRFFFEEFLVRHRGLAPRTWESYATAFRLLLGERDVRQVAPAELDPRRVLAFLERLEESRGNAASTRNQRLAALKSFWKAMQVFDGAHREAYERLLALPAKRATRRSPDYLEPEEMTRLLEIVDATSPRGFRDHLLVRFAYQTGARISELADVRLSRLLLESRSQVEIHGKGGKVRTVPLLDTTAAMVRAYLQHERPRPRPGYEDFLFLTRSAEGFGRQGLWKVFRTPLDRLAREMPGVRGKRLTPHSLRHTTAVFLLRAGVELNVIKAWLGHADLSTTSGYLDLDLDRKREALERFARVDVAGRVALADSGTTRLSDATLAWLETL